MQALRLAARLGQPDVDGMMAGMSARQFNEWLVFLRLETDPDWFGRLQADLQTARNLDPAALNRRLADRLRRLRVKRARDAAQTARRPLLKRPSSRPKSSRRPG